MVRKCSVTYWRTLWNRSKPRSSAAKAAKKHTYTVGSEFNTVKPHTAKQLLMKCTIFVNMDLCEASIHMFVHRYFQTCISGVNMTDVGLTGRLLLWRLAALWHVLCLWLWLCLSICASVWALSLCPGHQAEPCGGAGTGRLQDFTQCGTQSCFLLPL